MNIKILSDSTCDLSQALLEKYNISLMPLAIVKDGKTYRDSITITPADIFSHVAAGGDLCTTAAANIGEYEDFFKGYASEYDCVIHISLSAEFSSCYQNACLAADGFSNVYVVDSRNLSTGHGLVVLEACRLSAICEDADEICRKLNAFVTRVEASFLLDTLAYMVKGGRCSSVAALGANLLGIKPCIEVIDGKMKVVKKYRGNYAKCLATYVKDRLSGRENELDHGTLFVTRTPVTDTCKKAVEDAVKEENFFENVYWTEAGCTISCHCGPGCLGVLFVRK